MLQLLAQRSGEMVVLQCAGKIVAGEGLKGLQRTATTQRAAALIIDLRQVEILDAAGLGTFLRIKQWCDAQGMNLKFVNPGKHVQEVLALTGLDSVLDVCPASTDEEVQALVRECACTET
ncbi:MAG TPA: STAS domain-containing protein [Terriglobales bacterium]|nr:STAS domain-containing protein [Terriglobales bacterium]